MKTKEFVCLVCVVVVLSVVGNSWASTTWAYASISKSEHGAANDSDSDSAAGNCVSYADVTCPLPNDGSFATTTSRVTVFFGQGPGNIVGTSITSNNSDADPDHAITNQGTASFWSINLGLIGDGMVASANLYLQQLDLSVRNTGSAVEFQTLTMDLAVDQGPLYSGSFTLLGNGSVSGSGIYDPSFFSVTLSGENNWVAEYMGPPSLPFEMPANTDFELELFASAEGLGPLAQAGDYNFHELEIGLLGDFEFVPEPATMSLLALGGLAMLRRKGANRAAEVNAL